MCFGNKLKNTNIKKKNTLKLITEHNTIKRNSVSIFRQQICKKITEISYIES